MMKPLYLYKVQEDGSIAKECITDYTFTGMNIYGHYYYRIKHSELAVSLLTVRDDEIDTMRTLFVLSFSDDDESIRQIMLDAITQRHNKVLAEVEKAKNKEQKYARMLNGLQKGA